MLIGRAQGVAGAGHDALLPVRIPRLTGVRSVVIVDFRQIVVGHVNRVLCGCGTATQRRQFRLRSHRFVSQLQRRLAPLDAAAAFVDRSLAVTARRVRQDVGVAGRLR